MVYGTYLAVGAGALVAEVLSGAGHGCCLFLFNREKKSEGQEKWGLDEELEVG